jgi:MFS family permease
MTIAYRVVLIGLAVLFSFLCAGVVFGFQPLVHVLESSRVFHGVCGDTQEICAEQKHLLGQLFLVASCLTNASAIIIGYILDHHGPRMTILIGSVLFLFGNVGFSMGSNYEWLYLPSYGLLGIGGPFIFMSTLHLSEAFPRHSGLVISLLTGAFDSSSIIYELFSWLYQGTDGRIGIREFFLSYCIAPVLAFLYGLLMMPRLPFSASDTAVADDCETARDTSCGRKDDEEEKDIQSISSGATATLNSSCGNRSVISGGSDALIDENTPLLFSDSHCDYYPLRNRPLIEQISSVPYVLMVFFMCLHMLRLNFYMQTMSYQVRNLFGPEQSKGKLCAQVIQVISLFYVAAAELSSLFGLMLPIGGVIAIPPMAWLFDKFTPRVPFNLISVMTLVFGIGTLFPILWLQYASIIVFVIMRPILYTAASDYCAKAYGFRTFGQVYGLMVLMSALFGFSAYLLDYLVLNVFDGSYLAVNIIMTTLCATVGWLFPGWLYVNTK